MDKSKKRALVHTPLKPRPSSPFHDRQRARTPRMSRQRVLPAALILALAFALAVSCVVASAVHEKHASVITVRARPSHTTPRTLALTPRDARTGQGHRELRARRGAVCDQGAGRGRGGQRPAHRVRLPLPLRARLEQRARDVLHIIVRCVYTTSKLGSTDLAFDVVAYRTLYWRSSLRRSRRTRSTR